jgi:NDP-sugar pyrophosphorylase family protein
MVKKTILITTSGLGERLKYLTEFTNKSLVKVGDKYALCYIIECYDEDCEFVITLGYYGNYVREFLLLAYPSYIFIFIDVDKFSGPGSSLGYSMLKAKKYLQKPFIFHCCDSIVLKKITFEENKNTLCVFPSDNSNYYTNVKVNENKITEINNKKHFDFDFIYTGICYIYHFELFWSKLNCEYGINHLNTSLNDVDAMKKMMVENNIAFEYNILDNWYDTGNLDSYNNLIQIIKPKYYVMEKNYESLCFLNNKVIKFINDSEINKKRVLRGEYLYPLSPKILGYSDNFISMELIDGVILSDHYEYGIINEVLNWAKKNLWNETLISNDFKICCKNFYITKTIHRIKQIKFIKKEKHIINGLKCNDIIEIIENLPLDLLMNDKFTKFHGDFILDNIIKTGDSFKLIDWRHEFDNQLYYGDIYYDLAKFRHNMIINHANILNNLFTIKHINNEIIVDLKCNYFLIQQLNDFDKFINENNYDLNKINLITSIIWLNMSPLYDGELSEFLFYFGKYNLSLLL